MEEDIRPRSRQTSTNSTAYSSTSDVWSMNRRAGPSGGGTRTSSRTSIWSDEGATIAPPRTGEWDDKDISMLAEEGDGDGDRPLIELESNPGDGRTGVERVDMGGGEPTTELRREQEEMEEMTPAEKLKALLREMNSEVKETRATSPVKRARDLPRPPATEQRRGGQRDLMDDYSSTGGSDAGAPAPGAVLGGSTTRRSAWRDRRIGSGGSGSRTTRSESVEQEQRVEAGPSSPPQSNGRLDKGYDEEEEDDSPPTPPLRITNPYLYNRKPSRRSPTPPVASGSSPKKEERRVPTRVEVLHASASRSPPIPAPASPPAPARSALESFIAAPGTSYRAEALHSSISSEGSRKGKERAVPPSLPQSPANSSPRHHSRRTPSASSSIHEYTSTPPSKTPRARPPLGQAGKTPKRWTIDPAPEDAEDFAQAVEGLEVPGEVEWDIDEGMSSRLEIMRGLESESEAESAVTGVSHPPGSPARGHPRGAAVVASPAKSSPRKPRPPRQDLGSRDTTLQPPRGTHSRGTSEESLPALPEPETSDPEEDSRTHTLSSRRASLFRSTSKSPRASLSPQPHTPAAPRPASQSPFKLSPARSPPTTSLHRASPSASRSGDTSFRDSALPTRGSPARLPLDEEYTAFEEQDEEEQDEQEQDEQDESWRDAASSFARPSSSSSSAAALRPSPSPEKRQFTPQRLGSGNTTPSGLPTPHPPGFFSGTPLKQSVRFSPLRKHDGEWSVSLSGDVEGEGVGSVHRLKVSPIRHRSSLLAPPVAHKAEEEAGEEVGNTSFTARLRSLVRPSAPSAPSALPSPSRALASASPSLAAAARRSSEAAKSLEQSQTAFLAALSTFSSSSGAVGVAKAGWRWTTYAYWIALELLLCWAVFRVTLDYASSIYPHDPWSLHMGTSTSTNGLGIPLPSGVSGFLVQHRGSANFFDLLGKLAAWNPIPRIGLVGSMEKGWKEVEDLRMLGGVPT